MREKGYKRKSINSRAFRQERLETLQSHPLWGAIEFLVVPALWLVTCIWLECIFQESIQFGFENILREGEFPAFLLIWSSASSLFLSEVSRLGTEGSESWFCNLPDKRKLSLRVSFSCDCASSVLQLSPHRVCLKVAYSQLFGLDGNSLPSIMLRDIWAFCFLSDQISVTDYTVADKAVQKRGLKSLILCYPHYPNYLIILITAAN